MNYADPMAFNPDRFYRSHHGDRDEDVHDPQAFAFGFGRRKCPGVELADANVFIMMAMSLAAFDLCKATDEAGIDIIPPAEFISGTVRYVIRSRGRASFLRVL